MDFWPIGQWDTDYWPIGYWVGADMAAPLIPPSESLRNSRTNTLFLLQPNIVKVQGAGIVDVEPQAKIVQL